LIILILVISNIKLIYYHYKGENKGISGGIVIQLIAIIEKIFIKNLEPPYLIYMTFFNVKIMNKNKVISDKQSTDGEMTEIIMFRVTPSEKEYFETLTSIASQLDVDGKGTKVIKNNSLSDFVRMSLSITSNFYMSTIFPDSNVMRRLVNNKAKNEFIAFRKKYMNISTEFSS
jgi:hypothetical protein